MGRVNGKVYRGKTWQNERKAEETREAVHPGLTDIARLDEIRRVARQEPARLFLRAVPTQDYLVLLSQAGVLKARTNGETSCHLVAETGEAVCEHNGDPGVDCRQSWCRYATLMRMRLLYRLGEAYARARRRYGVA